MANDAANIGANFSNYQGNPNLGGGTLGVANVKTGPMEDFAKYVMLYNREEYLQRQKDIEKAADEIKDYMNYDLTTSIAKDAKILQDKYQKLLNFVTENPDAINYRNREKWTQYQRLRNDLKNDIRGGVTRSLMNVSREKEIADETDVDLQKDLRQRLDAEINATDIRTPIKATQQFDMTVPDLGKNLGMTVDVTKQGSNEIFRRDFTLFDLAEARRAGAAAELGFSNIDQTTESGKLKTIKANQNFFIKGAGILNQAIQSAKKTDGTIDEGKLTGLPIMKLINDTNKYIDQQRQLIKDGAYLDKLGNKITFGVGPFREQDYTTINWQDGISPSELAVVKQYAEWAGDNYKTNVTQTNDQLEQSRLGLGWFTATKGSEEDKLGASAVLNEARDIISKGEQVNVDLGGGKFRTVIRIGDPFLLKQFGNVEKDGTTTNVPDGIEYDKTTDQVKLIYYEPKSGKTQKNVIDDSKTKVLDQRGWLKEIAKRSFPNKDLGGVNTLVDEVLTKSGNSLFKLTQPEQASTELKKEYKLNGKTYSLDKIEKAAKQSNLTVEEYIKQAGLK